MWGNRLTEGDRIQQVRLKTIYANYLMNKSTPSFTRESGSGASGQGSASLDRLAGAVYGPCTVSSSDTGGDTGGGGGDTGGGGTGGGDTDTGLVTADLLIHFEANDPASYTGTGNTWVNIGTGGTDYNATLAGGDEETIALPVFINEEIKSFQFTLSFLGDGTAYYNNNYMYFPRPAAISDDFTWCAWIKTEEVGYGSNHYNLMFIVSTETGGLNNDFGFGLDSNGYLAYGDGSATGSDITIRSTQEVNTGTWTFVAVTREKATGSVVLYINGVEDTSGTCNVGNTLSTADNVLIGSETDFPGYTFGGYIGAILGNTSVLTVSQILQNFNAQRATYGV
jgi:hypothetical protein